MIYHFQALSSRRFQHGFDGVNLHRLTSDDLGVVHTNRPVM